MDSALTAGSVRVGSGGVGSSTGSIHRRYELAREPMGRNAKGMWKILSR